ncbi:hypothetical protein HJC23_005329 [Cyclotella cryptica]|uniref:Uncharacterized protein n=1 Tax=Cyclotella cryptica TaxID=29204 RepID=A0ABD3P7S7_9STRA|eukprot:CCRYP_016981-RA/>CCRYP_016981-RA protein AED:0.00 eAED:0.00 QI:466/-1/1/1/-1/1/1/67/473
MSESSPRFPPYPARDEQNALSPALEQPPSNEDSNIASSPNTTNTPMGTYNRTSSGMPQGYHLYYGAGNTADSNQRDYKLNKVNHSQLERHSVDTIDEHRRIRTQKQSHQEIYSPDSELENLSSPSYQKKPLPNMIISLAQRLLPTVVQRLCHHDEHRNMLDWADHNDDFEGHCAPLGTRFTEDVDAPNTNSNLKTTGLEDDELNPSIYAKEGYPVQYQRKMSDLEMGDPSDYLPQSAALLITTLQNSAKKERRKVDESSSREDLSSFIEETAKETDPYPREGFSTMSNMENFEREAEALLDSICGDELKRKESSSMATDDADIRYATPSFDDDDSIGGDMVRLSRSIAFLQHDLENVDLSHFDQYDDGFGGVCDLDNFEGEGTAWSRMKMWFSRGMIMEQKLLNSYTRMGNDNYGSSMGATASNSYADNPVLIWSLAIMWAFVLLVMGHSQVSEWAEGEDPGILADIIEWLFS